MNWQNPRRFIAQTRFEREQVLKALKYESVHPISERYASSVSSTPSLNTFDYGFRQELSFDVLHQKTECAYGGKCKALKENKVDYGDEERMAKEKIGFFTAAILANKWDGYYKYKHHFTWSGDENSGGSRSEIPILSPESYDKIYKKFESITMERDVYEIGGAMHYSKKDGQVHVNDDAFKNVGTTSTLVINGPTSSTAHCIEFHLHPNHCRVKARTCGLGWPSSADLKNIVHRSWMGNQCHVVFAFEGCYSVFMKPKHRKQKSREECLRALQETMKNVDVIVDTFTSHGRSYESSVPLWIEAINTDTSPLHVLFAPLGNGPLIPAFNCN
jgi:hypothetical protein